MTVTIISKSKQIVFICILFLLLRFTWRTPIIKVSDIANCSLRSSSSGDMSDLTSAAVVVSVWFPVSLSFWFSDKYVTSPFVDRLSIPFVTEDPIIKHTTEAVP